MSSTYYPSSGLLHKAIYLGYSPLLEQICIDNASPVVISNEPLPLRKKQEHGMRDPGSWEGVSSWLISYRNHALPSEIETVDVNQWFLFQMSNYCYKLWDLEFKSKPAKPKTNACHM